MEGDLEDELERLENALEEAVLDKESLEQLLEQTRAELDDAHLDAEAKLLEKELRIVELEGLMLQGAGPTPTPDRTTDTMMKEALAYKEAFEALKRTHIETVSQLNEKTYELRIVSTAVSKLDQKLITKEADNTALEGIVVSLQNALQNDEEIFRQNEEVEELLKERIKQLSEEVASYMKAWEDMSRTMKEREAKKKRNIVDLTAQLALVKERADVAEAYLVPRWQQIAEKHRELGGSLQSLQLEVGITSVDMNLEKAKNAFLVACVPQTLWSYEVESVKCVATIARCVGYAGRLLVYLRRSHFTDLVQDSTENPLSVGKDKGFIRWLQQATCSVARLVDMLCRFAWTIKMMDTSSEFAAIAGPASFLSECLPVFLEKLKRLCSAACIDGVSSALDMVEFNAMLSSTENHPSYQRLCGAVQQCSITCSEGIMAPTVASLLFRLAAATLLGICRAAYTDSAAMAVDVDLWTNLWVTLGRTLDSMLHNVADLFTVRMGYNIGLLTSRGGTQQLQATLTEAVTSMENAMCLIEDRSPDDIKLALIPQLTALLVVLPEVESMCAAFVAPPPFAGNTDPILHVMSSTVLEKLSNVVALENAAALARSDAKSHEDKIALLDDELQKTKAKLAAVHETLGEKQIVAERYEVVAAECKQLRTQERNFTSLLEQQAAGLEAACDARDALALQNDDLSKHLLETKRALDMAKKIPKHQHQAEWDAMELMHLRAAIAKLNRELYRAQVQHAEKDLDASDLERYIYSTTLTRSVKTTNNGCRDDATQQEAGALAESSLLLEESPTAKPVFETEIEKEFQTKGCQIVKEFHNLQQSVWMHALQIPFWQPNSTPHGMAANDLEDPLRRFICEEDALKLSVATLKARAENYLGSRLEGGVSKTVFGDHVSVAASRYLRSFSDLKGIAKQKGMKHGQPLPVCRIQLPPPKILQAKNISADTPLTENAKSVVRRLLVTDDQLYAVHNKLLGIGV